MKNDIKLKTRFYGYLVSNVNVLKLCINIYYRFSFFFFDKKSNNIIYVST